MDKRESRESPETAAKTGIEGLDEVLNGGLTFNRLYLIEGDPGAGKTTLAMQFLLEGNKRGETVLYITMSETEAELRAVADSHGFPLDNFNIFAATPTEDSLRPDQQYTMFHPSEVELSSTSSAILNEVERLKPSRVVFDSMSELRTLAPSVPQFRRQVLALKQFFAGRHCTVLILDDATNETQLRSIAHGVILLEQFAPAYGAERRRLQVVKYRGMQLRGGYHDYVIRRGGLQVFPRVAPSAHRARPTHARLSSGVTELDQLLGGGIERGNSTLILGAAGCGKSTLAMQFAVGAANQGLHAALFLFDESVSTLLMRADGLNIPVRRYYEAGMITLQPDDPAELSPGEFAHNVIRSAERDRAAVIVIDSLNGYLNSMPEERFLNVQLHELLYRLGQLDVATMLVGVQHGLVGSSMSSPVDASYLADTVLLLRYFEARGEIRQALSVLKKRGGAHERAIREFRLDGSGIRIGEPLHEFRGVLTGVPVYEGTTGTLLRKSRKK